MYLLRRFPGGAIVGRFFEEREAVRLLQREAVPRQPELVVDGRVVDAPRPVLDVRRHEDLRVAPRNCHGKCNVFVSSFLDSEYKCK